jgi:hypothetical protein
MALGKEGFADRIFVETALSRAALGKGFAESRALGKAAGSRSVPSISGQRAVYCAMARDNGLCIDAVEYFEINV